MLRAKTLIFAFLYLGLISKFESKINIVEETAVPCPYSQEETAVPCPYSQDMAISAPEKSTLELKNTRHFTKF
ncbi:hypothetical protein [Tychonema sp. BBK16]|uniref:hypothetical protein n=1 Tax=Tychonema sp. BBK16 TaxID=2699888 RepID=UPI001F256123|nr:hypothetical protein [Tychonema sp. BBK16]MCF6373476.1 hypothetical protein [Tychonema sp. BBK16]